MAAFICFLIAALLQFLLGWGALEKGASSDWFLISLGFFFLAFAFAHWNPVAYVESRRNPRK